MQTRKLSALLTLLILAALACNLPVSRSTPTLAPTPELSTPTLTATQPTDATAIALSASATAQVNLATSQAATAQAQIAQATANEQATAVTWSATANAWAISATATAAAFPPPPPLPPPPPPIQATRIRFAPGATSATVDGLISDAQPIDYLIAAQAGQTMLASVYSLTDDVYLGVAGLMDGIPLQRTAAGSDQFIGVLPATQDYRLTLVSPYEASPFTLQVIIPARIQFQPGAISASLPGQLPGGEVNYYLAAARGGQTMTVQIISPGNDIFLTIYGMTDGSPLVRSVMALTSWSGILPLTQDYMIEAVSTGGPSGYTLQVTIQ